MPKSRTSEKLAVVTGASSGIGLELARCCAKEGYGLVIAADEPEIRRAAVELKEIQEDVTAVEADLATVKGVDKLYKAVSGRRVDALLANAGRGLGGDFLSQDFNDITRVVNTNVLGTLYLLHKFGQDMVKQDEARILITGSIAGYIPGTYQAVYNGTKAFIDSFAYALGAELSETGVTVTLLMPGATETEFFERADMLDTKVGASEKDDPAEVAEAGFRAMLKGEKDIVFGWKNKLQTTIANVTPSPILAEQHRKMAEPGSAED